MKAANMDSPLPQANRRRSQYLAGLLLLLAFLLYSNTLLHGFVYDDHFQIEQNSYVHSFRYLGRIFSTTAWSFQGSEGQTNYYRPLMTFGYLVCNQVFQSFPFGFHLLNVLLHCAVVWLVYRLCAALFRDESTALLAAALFAFHPIHSEVVAWIAAVTELDLAFFYLLAFRLYLKLGEREGRSRRVTLALLCLSFILALLSKEQAITLPLLAAIYEHAYRPDRAETSVAVKVGRYAPLGAIATVYVVFRMTVLHAFAPVVQRPELGTGELVRSGVALVGQYAAKLLWPHPLLGFYVFHPTSGYTDARVLGGAAALLFSAALAAWLAKRARPYSFAVVWIALTLLPVLNVRWMAASAFAERYLYLPSFGFCALAAGGAVWCYRRARGFRTLEWAGAVALAALLAAAGLEIVRRNRDWRDDQTFFPATLAVDPHSSYMRTSLGAIDWSQDRRREAVEEWRRALVDKPDNPIAVANLGMAMGEEGRWAEAEPYLQKAIELRPRYAAPHVQLGKVYARTGRTGEAAREFRRAVEISPLSSEARNQLAKFYLAEGRSLDAEEQYRASLAGVETAEAWNGLGDLASARGSAGEAAACWKRALEFSPFDEHAHAALGGVYLSRGLAAAAEAEYRAVLLLNPRHPEALEAMHRLKPLEFPEP
jgi:tetratricopeptide (TPR) repeat protein